MKKGLLRMLTLGCLSALLVQAAPVPISYAQEVQGDAAVYMNIKQIEENDDYVFVSKEVLDDGLIRSEYVEKSDGISLCTSTAKYNKYVYFHNANGVIIYSILQSTSWAYGGAAGSVPYLAGATNAVVSIDSNASIVNTYSNTVSNVNAGCATYYYYTRLNYKGLLYTLDAYTTCDNNGNCY